MKGSVNISDYFYGAKTQKSVKLKAKNERFGKYQ